MGGEEEGIRDKKRKRSSKKKKKGRRTESRKEGKNMCPPLRKEKSVGFPLSSWDGNSLLTSRRGEGEELKVEERLKKGKTIHE